MTTRKLLEKLEAPGYIVRTVKSAESGIGSPLGQSPNEVAILWLLNQLEIAHRELSQVAASNVAKRAKDGTTSATTPEKSNEVQGAK